MKALACGIVLLALAALPACDRTPRFVPASADSTAAVPADSAMIYVQMARQLWDSPAALKEASDVTARVVLQDLRQRPGEPVAGRAAELIDSLHLGAEVAGGGDFAVVNFFARSHPTEGSWPYLFWRQEGSFRAEPLEARNMRLVGAALEPRAPERMRMAGLFSRQGSQGPQPFAYVWQRSASGWRLVQSLGPDSLGLVGAARLVEPQEDGAVLISRSWRVARGFDECASCPHLYRTRRFRWGSEGLQLASEEVERSPYATFVQLVQALAQNDREAALGRVADPSLLDVAESYEWGRPKGTWRLAPGSSAKGRDLLLLRGQQEAYRVHFSERGEDWVVTALEPSVRAID